MVVIRPCFSLFFLLGNLAGNLLYVNRKSYAVAICLAFPSPVLVSTTPNLYDRIAPRLTWSALANPSQFAGKERLDRATSSGDEAQYQADKILEFCHRDRSSGRAAKSLPIAGRKRLEIGRALATHRTLLLLDETAAGLNPTEVDEAIDLNGRVRDRTAGKRKSQRGLPGTLRQIAPPGSNILKRRRPISAGLRFFVAGPGRSPL